MKNHRIISYSCAAAAAILLALPGAAQAGSSTLSGYGGPGEGNQAVLGSALVGGHRGGGSGGGTAGRGSAGGEGSATSTPEVQPGASPGQAGQGAGEAHSSSGGNGSGNGDTSGGNAKRGVRAKARSGTTAGSEARPVATTRTYYPAAEHVPAGGQGTLLGLTADDLLYVVLALVILVLLGLLTRRLDDSASSARSRG